MPMEDQVIVKFLADMSGLRGAINTIGGQLSNIGSGGQQTQRAAAGIATVTRNTRQLTGVVSQNNRQLDTSAGLMKELQIQTGGVSSSFRQASRSLQTSIPWLDKFAIQTDRASMVMWKFSMGAIGLRDLAMTTGTVAAGLIMATKAMATSVSLVDRVKRQFAAIYQSAEIGGKMVDQLVGDAVKIRYSVNEVLDAGRLLSLEGFDPRKLIFDMADLAAGVNQEGITIVNATRAFVDATNGQFRRLKETFQVTREDAMQFAPDAFAGPNGQITNQAKATEAIIRAIRAKYRGQNAATMQTIQGQASNLGDAIVRALAKTDAAIKPILMGWMDYGMQFFDKLGAFAETGLGKATASTIVWGAALMTAVSALALLAGGMMTMMGLFAAYRVFTQTRQDGVMNIIKAELELMAVQKEIAEYDAIRSSKDIASMKLKLDLAKAIYAEEQKRLSGMGVPLSQAAIKLIGGRSEAELTQARKIAQAKVDAVVKPRELLGMNDSLKAIQEEIAAIEATSLGTQSERYAVLKEQELVLLRQTALLQAQVDDAKSIAAGGAGGRTEAVMASQQQEDAAVLAARAADEERLATQLQTEQSQLSANVTELRARQELLAAEAIAAKTAAIEADTLAIAANNAAQAAAAAFADKQRIVKTLATPQQVDLYRTRTAIKELELDNMRSAAKKAMEKGDVSPDAATLANLRIAYLEEEVNQRKRRLPEMESQAAILADSERELGVLDEQKRLTQDAARAASENASVKAAAARQAMRDSVAVSRELRNQEQLLDRVTAAYEKQAIVAGNAQAEAAAAAAVVTTADTETTAVAQVQVASTDAQIVRLKAMEAKTQAEILALGDMNTVAEQRQLAVIQERIAAREAELAVLEATRVANVGGGAALAGGRAANFKGGFGKGFVGVFGGLGDLVMMVVSPLKAAFSGLIGAISSAGGFMAVLGMVTGGLAAVAVAAGVLIGAWKLLIEPANKAQQGLDRAAKSAGSFAEKMNRATAMLGLPPSAAAGAEESKKFLEDLSKYGKEVSNYQLGEAIRPVDFAKNKLGMDDEAAANFARRFWELWDADMRRTVADYGKSGVGKTISQIVSDAGGWKNVTPEQMKQIEKAMTGGTFGIAVGTGSAAEWRGRLGRMGATVNAEQQGLPSTQLLRQQAEAVNAEVEKIRALATGGDEAGLKSQYGFGSLAAAQEFLKTIDESTDKVGVFNEEIQNSYQTYKDMGVDIKSANDYLDEQNETLLSDAQINAELAKQANTARIAYEGMLATSQALLNVDVKGRAEREKDLAVAKQRLAAAEAQYKYADAVRRLGANQNAEALLDASGMGNMGAIFGQEIATGEWVAALAETDPKKRRERVQNAFKTSRSRREDETKQALDFYAPGPNAGAQEQAAYERYRATKERERMAKAVSDYNVAIQHGNLTPEQQQRAQTQIATEQRASERRAAEAEKRAREIEAEDKLKRMQSARDYATTLGASPQQLATLDAQILATKLAEAKANNDIAEQMALQVQYAQLQKTLQDDLLGTEEAKLSYMETQASQGLISDEAVRAEKQRMAQLYQERAKQAAYGSAEYYQYMQKALQMLGGETEDKWDTIIGKIIGAPQSMLNSVLSEGWISRQFGDAANRFGLSQGIQADIVSQRNSEMTIRLTWEGINAIDSKLNSAVQTGINGFVRDFKAALSGA